MANKDINIKFNTKADTTGAKQTAEAIKEIKKNSEEVAKSTSGAGAFDSYVKGAEKAQRAAERLNEALGKITATPDSDPFANAAKETARELDSLLEKQRELLNSSRQNMDIAGLDDKPYNPVTINLLPSCITAPIRRVLRVNISTRSIQDILIAKMS